MAVFAVAVYVVSHHDRVPSAGATPGYSAGAGVSGSTSTSKGTSKSTATSGSPSASDGASGSSGAPQSLDTVVFLGDEYTSGTGGSGTDKGFVALTAEALGVQRHALSVPMGGYAKKSSSGRVYADRIDSVVKLKPEVVVITGGRNDISDDQTTMEQAVADFYSTLHQALPNATLIAVAPFFGDSDAPTELGPVADAVKKGVTGAGGTYLDLPDPLHGHPGYMADAADPNDKGYAAIAKALIPKLTPLLPGR